MESTIISTLSIVTGSIIGLLAAEAFRARQGRRRGTGQSEELQRPEIRGETAEGQEAPTPCTSPTPPSSSPPPT